MLMSMLAFLSSASGKEYVILLSLEVRLEWMGTLQVKSMSSHRVLSLSAFSGYLKLSLPFTTLCMKLMYT